ncbi:phage tail protein [Noviherbaspirillum suwonense]|uniref:Phage tail protein n=1 Tax=Noviherbaspirillum suwonense TaxID=1224511 RepID=A0ABY1QIP9_9BURK|nr:phage tail protein [Noviherbaspirillum suwonense]SMP72000.1 Putative phage tail protein [Noviherbaspirillum suwonense]
MIPKLPKRQRRKFKKLLATCVTFAALATASGNLQAEPVTGSIATALMYFVGYDTAIAIAAAVVSFAVSSALSYAVGAITQPSTGGYSSNALSNRTHMVRSSVAPRNMVYGRCMVSGPLAFIGTSNRGDGTNGVGGTTIKGGENAFLHLVVMLANHEIDGVEEVYLGDDPIGFSTMVNNKPTGGKFGNLINQGDAITTTFTVPANSTGITLGGLGATSILGLAEVGATPAAAPSGGEGGVDAFGNPILPNGGTASIDTAFTFVNATTVTTPAVNRSRNMAITFLSKGTPASYVDCYAHLGSPSQTANTALIASCPAQWTAAHRLQGVAYLYIRLLYNTKVFPNGIPNVKAMVRGKKVRDPRSGSYPNDAPTWKANYALCAMDYLKSADGLGCTDADLDLEQIKVAANICDEVVNIRDQYDGRVIAEGLPYQQYRYEAHGTLLLDHDVEENLRSLSTAGGGPVPLLVSGRFQIPVGYYGTPVAQALTESDLRAAVKVRPRTSRRDLFNAVGGTYVDGRISWQPTDFPEVANSFYQSQDAGEKIRRDVTFPFTTDEIMAQRLAKIMLERSRQGITIDWPGKPSCFRLSVGDLVPVTLAKFGWNAKVFRVIAWSMESNGTIDLVLQEDATGVYDWNYGQATTTDLSKDTDLPDPSYITPVGALTLYSDSSELVRTGDGTIVSRLHVIWPASTDASVVNGGEFQVQYKKASETFWTPWDKVSGAFNETWISPVVDTETYYVRVRAVNSRDIETDWVYAKHKIIGNTGAPPNVSNFTVTVRADGTRSFSWSTSNQPVNVTTGGGYRLKYRPGGSNAAWADMTPLHNGLLSQSPLQIADPVAGFYDFGIVAVNASRVESSTPAMINDATIGKEPVSYEASVNLIPNSDWQMSNGTSSGEACLYGWTLTTSDNGSYAGAARPAGMGRNRTPWNIGRGGAWLWHSTTVANASGVAQPRSDAPTASIYTSDGPGGRFMAPVTAGVIYEASVFVNPHQCQVEMTIEWFKSTQDGNGQYQRSTVATSSRVDGVFAAGAGSTGDAGLGGYTAPNAGMYQLWGTITAPSDAAFARIVLIKHGTFPDSGGLNKESYAFWNKAMLCIARQGVTRQTATPWIEFTYDQLHGGSLAGGSVDSAQVAAEAATTVRVTDTLDTGRCTQNPANGQTAINSIPYTAAVDCTVTVFWQVKYLIENTGNGTSGGTVIVYSDPFIQLGGEPNGANDPYAGSKSYVEYDAPAGQSISGTRSGSRTYTMQKGGYAVFYLTGAGGASSAQRNIYLHPQWSSLRLEVVKR